MRRLALVGAALAAAGAHAQSIASLYSVTDVPLYASAPVYLGEQGQIVGNDPTGATGMQVWTPASGASFISPPPGSSSFLPKGFNKAGEIYGISDYPNPGARMAIRHIDGSYELYPSLPGLNASPLALNNNHQLLFQTYVNGSSTTYYWLSITSSIQSMAAVDINNPGFMIGAQGRRAPNGTWTPLQTPPGGGGPLALNDSGWIIGRSPQQLVSASNRMLLWNPQNQLSYTVELGPNSGNGDDFPSMWELNESTMASGSMNTGGVLRAAAWDPVSGLVNLNSRIGTATGSYTLRRAIQLNDNGQMICEATKNGQALYVYLQPVPEPLPVAALGLGLVGLLRRRRR